MNPLLLIASDSAVEIASNVAPEVAKHAEGLSILDLAMKGGWIMIVLAALLVLALYITIERWLTISKAVKTGSDDVFMEKIRKAIHEGNVDEAKRVAKSFNSPIARMIGKGLSRLGRPLPDIQAAIENVGRLEVAELEKRVSLVATVASLGPMIGFLGTVTGMVRAFFDMAHAGNIEINMLAGGIYEAMVTTVGGLIVGIVCYFLYNILVGRINKVVNDLEVRAAEFMDLLHEPA